MPTIKKEMPRKAGQMMSNRYQFRRFKHAEDMHKFLNKSDNALFWKETLHDLPSGTYRSQISVCRDTRKAIETFTKV